MRRPIRWNTGSPSSSSRSRIWRLIADWETCSFSPAAVNEPVSAMARMISSCRRSMASGYLERGARPGDGLLQIALVHLDPDEAHAELRAGHRCRSEAEKRVGDDAQPLQSVEPQAHLRQLRRKRRRVRPILLAALDGLVGDEPGVAAAAYAGSRGLPAPDVRLVLILHADRLALQGRRAARSEVEDEFVAVVEESTAVDRLVMPDGQVVLQAGAGSGERLFDGDRLDPVDGVLKLQVLPGRLRHVQGCPGIRRLGADVQEERPIRRQRAGRPANPLAGPRQVAVAGQRVVIGPIADSEVVWRRRDDDGNRGRPEAAEQVDRVSQVEAERCVTGLEGGVRLGETRHLPRFYRTPTLTRRG